MRHPILLWQEESHGPLLSGVRKPANARPADLGGARMGRSKLIRIFAVAAMLVLAVLLTVVGVRAYDSLSGPPLEPWHTFVPRELTIAEMDAADWPAYLKAEDGIFEDVRREVVRKLPPEDRVPENRYYEASPIYPGHFTQDWNRSFELKPDGAAVGAVVLLHGLTDSPYSLRHIAEHYRERGFIAIGIRLPGHGTVPAGLSDVDWPEWMAATRLAVREAVRAVGPGKPVHLVGYSNGGALALKYTLDALADPTLRKPDRLVLLSPMVGVTAFARFAGIAGWPAVFPAFVRASWLSILPEFNPFKYNSFPVDAAVQSFRLTQALQRDINDAARTGRLQSLPPVLTFQSVVDHTVSTRAIIRSLYGQLPTGRHELVLFDINRAARLGPLLGSASDTALDRLLPPAPRNYRTTVISNAAPSTAAVAEFRTEAGSATQVVRNLGIDYPSDNFSLSHVALPFPPDDALYGSRPNPEENFGINLGALASHGEIGVLILSLDSLLRLTSNPFYDYMIQRIDEPVGAPLAPS